MKSLIFSLFLLISLSFTTLRSDIGKTIYIDDAKLVKLKKRQLPENPDECHFCHLKKKLIFIKGTKRTKREHTDMILLHGREKISCNNCHELNNSNYLTSSKMKRATFDNSAPTCQQCHAAKYRDWSQGIHGKRTGRWNGPRIQYHCIDCHDPHDISFPEMEVKLTPKPPHFYINKNH